MGILPSHNNFTKERSFISFLLRYCGHNSQGGGAKHNPVLGRGEPHS